MARRLRQRLGYLYWALIGQALRPVYKIYERELFNQVRKGNMPKHVGIILDGNRRWAKENGLSPWEGHRMGFLKAKTVLDWCLDLDIRYVTYYTFSTENFSRDEPEIDEIMKIAAEAFKEVVESPRIHSNRVRFRAIGRTDLLPDTVKNAIREAEDTTRAYERCALNIAIGYGGRREIVDAMKKMFGDIESGRLKFDQIDEETFSHYLYTAGQPDPDIIIRTSGEERLSGFLLWQSAYSELYFCEVYWPAFRHIDFLRAIRTYQRRMRRYGK